ncbi:MAG: AAA family ATPase [Proteobacteria bacterium]|nr:AAA family ATPase [Pseudomonadota bacterium]MBU4296074.1 AAA family ATPase [Pseudomonadota bacterium]MCG2748010.1 AAA family ATPase [Desulfobulbaceae bacterium]
MLNSLTIKNFTAFADAEFSFSPGLNVLIGANGTGKTHILKLGYLFSRAWPDLTRSKLRLDKKRTDPYMEERLAGLFRVSELASLVRQGHKNGASLAADIGGSIPTLIITVPGEQIPLPSPNEPMAWEIHLTHIKNHPAQVESIRIPESAATNAFVPKAIFVPSKEIVSLFKGLIGLFENYRQFPLDETYKDLAVALATLEPAAPSPLLPGVAQRIAALLGGELRLEDNNLIFLQDNGRKLESQLLAEGYRKLAMLIYLVRNRVIEAGSTVFWDEPEANLNPAALRLLVEALRQMVCQGVQVILATHSLFLLREFEVLGRTKDLPKIPERYFALNTTKKGVEVSAGDDIVSIDPLVLLDEDQAQSDRFMETLA